MARHHRSPPNSAAAGSEVELVRRLDADVVVDVGGKLKVTCHGCPRCDGGGARTGGACAAGRPLRGGLAGSVSMGFLAALMQSVDILSILSPISRRKKCVDRSSTR